MLLQISEFNLGLPNTASVIKKMYCRTFSMSYDIFMYHSFVPCADHCMNAFHTATSVVFFFEEDPTQLFRQLIALLQEGPKENREYKEIPEKVQGAP